MSPAFVNGDGCWAFVGSEVEGAAAEPNGGAGNVVAGAGSRYAIPAARFELLLLSERSGRSPMPTTRSLNLQ
jgi:hypothetical protein